MFERSSLNGPLHFQEFVYRISYHCRFVDAKVSAAVGEDFEKLNFNMIRTGQGLWPFSTVFAAVNVLENTNQNVVTFVDFVQDLTRYTTKM